MNSTHPYESLTPEAVLSAVESTGRICDGRMLALNSYENRVYQVGIEGEQPVIVKFYRPERWSRDQILEEHSFVTELANNDLSVVQADTDEATGTLLHRYDPFWFAVFPRRGGRSPDLDLDTLEVMGRTLGKLHAVGSAHKFRYRPQLTLADFGQASVAYLLEHDFIGADLRPAYESLARDLIQRMTRLLELHKDVRIIRLHGDCHPSNVLWRDGIPHLVDFDDCRSGPAVQDLWMLLSGERDHQQAQLSALIEGYEMFHHFNPRELALVETLRTLRIMHYSAWLARRWDDPAFPHSFPWFNTARYWSGHILELREQLAALDEPSLQLF